MNCEETRNLIDRNVFESQPDLERHIAIHIEDCDNCKQYYEEAVESVQIIQTLRKSKPYLDRPEALTNEIMQLISQNPVQEPSGNSSPRIITRALRFLAAASVLLFIVFGTEQFIILGKIQSLEASIKQVSKKRNYRASQFHVFPFKEKQLIHLLQTQQSILKTESSGLRHKLLVARLARIDLQELAELSSLVPEIHASQLNKIIQSN